MKEKRYIENLDFYRGKYWISLYRDDYIYASFCNTAELCDFFGYFDENKRAYIFSCISRCWNRNDRHKRLTWKRQKYEVVFVDMLRPYRGHAFALFAEEWQEEIDPTSKVVLKVNETDFRLPLDYGFVSTRGAYLNMVVKDISIRRGIIYLWLINPD